MDTIQVHDRKFKVSISSARIQQRVKEMAEQINKDLEGKDVIFLGILNGAFMFAADLFRHIRLNCRISFLKLSSYQGTSSSGTVKSLIGINEELRGKTVVILEDIVDSGDTLENIIRQLRGYEPEGILTATFLFKPEAYQLDIPLDYVGLEIPNDFVVGYGLDYDGYGRNLPDIYSLHES